jgi:hypothetical protein
MFTSFITLRIIVMHFIFDIVYEKMYCIKTKSDKISYDPKWTIAYEAEEVFPWEIIGSATRRSTPSPYTVSHENVLCFSQCIQYITMYTVYFTFGYATTPSMSSKSVPSIFCSKCFDNVSTYSSSSSVYRHGLLNVGDVTSFQHHFQFLHFFQRFSISYSSLQSKRMKAKMVIAVTLSVSMDPAWSGEVGGMGWLAWRRARP